MALNTLTIYFEPCLPSPAEGYRVKYRPLGSDELYRTSEQINSTPAIINDTQDDEPTSYEGFIYSDCGNGIFGSRVPFTAINPDADSQSGDGSGSDQSISDSEPPPPSCRIYNFAVFGGDSDIWSLSGTNCDGTPYIASGFVGDGPPPDACLIEGSLTAGGTPIVWGDAGPC